MVAVGPLLKFARVSVFAASVFGTLPALRPDTAEGECPAGRLAWWSVPRTCDMSPFSSTCLP